MALWMVRSGKYGEREQYNREHAIVSIGWEELPDLRATVDRAQLTQLMRDNYSDKSASAIANWVGQVWTFAKLIQVGDLVAMPLKSSPAIAFGKVTGDYTFTREPPPGAEHRRSVEWLRTVPRSAIDPDLLFSFGAIMTVCRIGRNDAEARVRALLNGTALPVLVTEAFQAHAAGASEPVVDDVDLEEILRDAIRTHITRKFAGHGLAELVEAVLSAQGYKTFLSPPGADGGVDVLAGSGPHGFDGARLAVQVKSGSIEVDTDMLRLFQQAMSDFGAGSGLIVSWGGFRNPVARRKGEQFFKIRMWNADDLIAEVLSCYDKLPASIQARLPLKRTWILDASTDE